VARRAFERGDRDDPDLPWDEPERQQVDRLDRESLRRAHVREELQEAEAQEHGADRDPQRCDPVAHERTVKLVLDGDEAVAESVHVRYCGRDSAPVHPHTCA
jgi:hypothetical protein